MTPQFVNNNYNLLRTAFNLWLDEAKYNAQFGSGIFGGGDIRELEKLFSNIFHSKFALAVSSGTAALHVALVALNVRKKTKVIILGSSWIGLGSLVKSCGAIPVYANLSNLNPILEEGCKKIETHTVLIYVRSTKDGEYLKKVRQSCVKNNIPTIEDWSAIKNVNLETVSAPSYGDFAVFSFGYDKWLQAGEGGIVLLNQKDYFEKITCFSQHPISQKSHGILNNQHLLPALNYRIHPIAAKIALLQMREYIKNKNTFNVGN